MVEKGKLMSVKEVAELLGVSQKSVYRLIEKGQLSGFKIGGTWRLAEKDVEAYLERTRGVGKYPGRVFGFWVLTRYYQAPQKYQITKRGQTGWLSLREGYLKKLSEAQRVQEEFKPVKYRRIRLSYGETAIMISPRYFARLPEAEQKEWLKSEIKST